MARDIQLYWNTDIQEGDINYAAGDLIREEGLETAVLMSLFTDRRADSSDTLPDTNNPDRKGWWGDVVNNGDVDRIGSKLWLLERAKATQINANLAKQYIEEALEWMIEDGVAAAVNVDTWIFGDSYNRRLGCHIEILKKDGDIETYKFDDLWNAQFGI